MEKKAGPALTQQRRASFFAEALQRFSLNRRRCLALDVMRAWARAPLLFALLFLLGGCLLVPERADYQIEIHPDGRVTLRGTLRVADLLLLDPGVSPEERAVILQNDLETLQSMEGVERVQPLEDGRFKVVHALEFPASETYWTYELDLLQLERDGEVVTIRAWPMTEADLEELRAYGLEPDYRVTVRPRARVAEAEGLARRLFGGYTWRVKNAPTDGFVLRVRVGSEG